MRLTLAWLSVCLAIYCGGGHGHGNVVLSLPPSLIATATKAALSQQQQQLQHPMQLPQQKKDARVLFDMLPNSPADSESRTTSEDFNRNADDLGVRQSAPQEIAPGLGFGLGPGATPPRRYWSNRCQGRSGASANCPQEYYRTMLAARNKEALARLHLQLSSMQESDSEVSSSDSEELLGNDHDDEDDNVADEPSNEVFMLLTGEQDLIKFLHWAMQLLYPVQRAPGNLSDGAAENYYPGMFLWKKLNLSGHLEPPLIVDEPQYVLVRREKLFDGYQWGEEQSQESDPFIPPRGRKHNSPDLDALMNRYEPFVPNRGKRDKVKDLFKYDDLFYPHRGKKHRNLLAAEDDPFFATRGKKLQLRDLYNVDDPFVPNRGKRFWRGWGAEPALPADDRPQRMSTHKINGYDQSVRPSLSAEDAVAPGWRLAANRLHPTRSMSSADHQQQHLQQQEQLLMWPQQLLQQHVRFIGNPNHMRQQVKTASSNGEERLRRSLPKTMPTRHN